MEPTFIQVHSDVTRYLEELHETQEHLHKQYKEYLEKNRSTKVFGLDSFYYQSKLYDLETKQLNEQYLFINNRIYCDYYKLYGMVKIFYKDNFKLETRKRSYPIYKDLETFKSYDIQDTLSLNVDIAEMIKKAYACVHKNEEDIQIQTQTHTSNTYNIDNYIYNHRYNNTILKNKVELYEKYLHSYHIYHMSFLSHLRDKIMLLFRQSKNRVVLGNTESWVNERVIEERVIQENSVDPLEIVIHPTSLVPKVLEEIPEVPVEVIEVPEEVIEVPEEVPEVPVEVLEVPVEVLEVPVEVPVEVIEVPVEVLEVPVEVLEVPEVPAEVPVEVPVEVPEVPIVTSNPWISNLDISCITVEHSDKPSVLPLMESFAKEVAPKKRAKKSKKS